MRAMETITHKLAEISGCKLFHEMGREGEDKFNPDVLQFIFNCTEVASHVSLAHITDGPEVKDLRSDRVEVCFYQDQTLVFRTDP